MLEAGGQGAPPPLDLGWSVNPTTLPRLVGADYAQQLLHAPSDL